MIRVGIIGCGKVADKHASQIRRLRNTRIVGVCDEKGLMAAQLAERFNIRDHFDDVKEMLAACRPRCRPHHDAASQSLCSGKAMS